MRSSMFFRAMTVVAGASTMMAWGCNWSFMAKAFTAGFFGVLGAEALLVPQVLLGYAAYLPGY